MRVLPFGSCIRSQVSGVSCCSWSWNNALNWHRCSSSSSSGNSRGRSGATSGSNDAIAAVRGMRVLNHEECSTRAAISEAFQAVAQNHCFREISTPLVERASVFTRTLGPGSDVVAKEMYCVSAPSTREQPGSPASLSPHGVAIAASPTSALSPLTDGHANAAPAASSLTSPPRGIEAAAAVVSHDDDSASGSLTLRPEGTAGVMRAAISGGLLTRGTHALPLRLFYSGPMFRHERPQAGRYRQFTQLGVELIGSHDAADDVEVIAMADAFLASVLDKNALRVTLLLNSLGDTATRAAYVPALRSYLSQHAGALSVDSRARILRGSPLRVLDSKDPGDRAVIADAPCLSAFLSAPAGRRFEAVTRGLDDLNVAFTLSPTLVRGLDYYTHTIFEFVAAATAGAARGVPASTSRGPLGAASSTLGGSGGPLGTATSGGTTSTSGGSGPLGTLLAGGRYDGLCKSLGGPQGIGAVGWAAGLDRLALLTNLPVQVEVRPHAAVLPILPRAAPIASEVEAVERKHPSATPSSGEPSLRSSPSRTDVEVGALERRISTLCLVTAQALRANGIPAVILHGGRTVKKQVAAAAARGARYAVIVGENEATKQCVAVKDLATGAQVELSAAAVGPSSDEETAAAAAAAAPSVQTRDSEPQDGPLLSAPAAPSTSSSSSNAPAASAEHADHHQHADNGGVALTARSMARSLQSSLRRYIGNTETSGLNGSRR